MRRVLILGPCGAGKSTLATALAARLNLPLFHMDRLAWRPGWIDSTQAEVRAALAPVVSQDRWLIEGNYGSTLDTRLPHADTVVLLDYPITLCLTRLARRWWRWRGRTRPDMTPGCPERIDPAFWWYVARWNTGPRRRLEEALSHFEGTLLRHRRPRETARWLAGLAPR